MSFSRTDAPMADGRTLRYYDETPGRVPPPDPRDLPAVEHGSVMRFDVLTGEWVTIAAHRMNRTHLPPADLCPLCPTRPGGEPSEVPADAYDVVAFDNRFPSFGQTMTEVAPEVDGNPLWPQRPATGRCEVVCFTSDHDAAFSTLPLDRVRTVIDVWADRTAELSAVDGVEQVFPFENRGREIGVSLQHPHGQIFGYPYVTPRTAQLLGRAAAHRQRTGRDLMQDVLDGERKAGHRVVVDGEHWTAFVPAAARWPVEVHVVPHRHVLDLAELDGPERDELAHLYPDLLARLDRFFVGDDGGPITLPYIAGWFAAPVGPERDGARDALPRLHLQVFSVLRAAGRLKYLAGSESGQGAWVSDTTPERIADRIRELPSVFPGAAHTGPAGATA